VSESNLTGTSGKSTIADAGWRALARIVRPTFVHLTERKTNLSYLSYGKIKLSYRKTTGRALGSPPSKATRSVLYATYGTTEG
jgi:hypothetical protein